MKHITKKRSIIVGIVIIFTPALYFSPSFAHAQTSSPVKLPYLRGQSFVVVQGYNTPPTHINKDSYALDFSKDGCEAYGQPVAAALGGVATIVQEQGYNGGYGTELLIDHGNNIVSRYAHMIPGSIEIGVGDAVHQGQIVGDIGNTGLVAGLACGAHPGTHLHFVMNIRQSDGTLLPYDPEPVSGYRNITAGKWYLSDNDEYIPVIPTENISSSVASTPVVTATTTNPEPLLACVMATSTPQASTSEKVAPPVSSGGVSVSPAAQPPVSIAENSSSTQPTLPLTPPLPVSTNTTLFEQLNDSENSTPSFYDDNWFDLGAGFSGTLNSLTLEGRVSNQVFFASHVFLQEFKDANYTGLVEQFTISDSAPFTYDMATTTFNGLSILLKPYFYYRLATIQDYQNRSVILAGTSATGTMMWDNFVYGTGLVQYTKPFMPYVIMNGLAATSTLVPPDLTTPTNLTSSFNSLALQVELSWSTSTDPDWAGNPLHYDVNYSTSTTLDNANWGSSLPIYVAVGNSYFMGVRAADNFGDVSDIATTTWDFPLGFTPYRLSPNLSYATQQFTIPTTTALNSIGVFTGGFSTSAANQDAVGCSLALLDEDTTSSYAAIGSDNGYNGNKCNGDPTFSFASSGVVLLANHPYEWIFQTQTGNPSTNASIEFYGTSVDTAGGPFSDPSIKNARFVLTGPEGTVFAN